MVKNWRVALLVAAINVVLSISSVANAQVVVVGAYGETSPTNPEVISAASFAVTKAGQRQGSRISLISIDRAEQQVVAGMNYKIWLKVRSRGAVRNVTTVVYQNLKRRYSLTSWEVESAGGGSDVVTSNSTIEQLVASLAEAYTSKTLGKMDAQRHYVGSVRVVIENSLAPDNARDRFESRTFKTLEGAEQWLRTRERGDDGPSRETKPLQRCSKGLCTYNFDGGISHNQLYLKKVSYGSKYGRPYIKTIYLLDGD